MKRLAGHLASALLCVLPLWACPDEANPNQPAGPGAAPVPEQLLSRRLQALQREHPRVPGFAVVMQRFDGAVDAAATGTADPAGRPMTADTPVRIASITKTFVAASVLRLWERDLLDLDAPVSDLISDDHDQLLRSDGYRTDAITVRHLLMHAGGVNDHFSSDAFKRMVMADPARVWTRTDQLRVMVQTTEPLAPPGERFAYSDAGYLLLGEVIEQVTGQSLGAAVRELVRLQAIGLGSTWWDAAEERPAGVPDRAHQWLEDVDTWQIHGSVDAWGGGGIVASTAQAARFVAALFQGRVFARPETLALMTRAPGHPEGSPYRMGLFTREVAGQVAYGHGGFWGTDVLVVPAPGIVIAGTALAQSGVDDLRAMSRDLAQTAADAQP